MIFQRISFGILILVFVAVASSLCTSEALADPLGHRTVTVTCDPLVTPDFGKCDADEHLTVKNGCGKTIQVSYNGGPYKSIFADKDTTYVCTNDDHDCYSVTVPAKLGGTESSTGCSEPFGEEKSIPTLTQWGMIILVVLIVSSALWLWRKKRARLAA